MQKVAFIINRTISKFNKRKNEISSIFDSSDFETKYFVSERCRHIEDLAQNALSEGFEYLIFVGGDGTINEGINGLMAFFRNNEEHELDSYDLEQVKKIKIGLLPLGSGNDFAKTIQISKDLNQLKENILANKSKLIDIGFSKFLDENLKPTSRFYINITDVGMGGIIAKKIIDKNNAFNADLIYVKAIFTTLLNYKKNKVKYTSDKETWESNIMSLIFANGRFFGSGLGVSPDASIQDGVLNIIKLGNINVFDYIYHLKDLKKSKHIQHKEVSYSTAKNLKVEAIDGSQLLIDMDGEFVGYAPLEIECLPLAMNFIY